MIKHGSGMALCLKYVTNKVPPLAPLTIRRTRVSVCNGPLTKRSFTSPFMQECQGNSDISPSSLVSDYSSIGDLKNCGKVLSLKCDSNVINYVSYLIFDSDDNRTTQSIQLQYACQCSDSMFGIPYKGTPDDFKFTDICDFKNNTLLYVNRGREELGSHDSDVGVQNSAPNRQESLHKTQNTKNNSPSEDSFQPPSEDQLAHIHRTLANDLPSFFIKPLDLKIYHPNIVFEDNIRGKRFVGLLQYNFQAKLLYIIGHLRFMYIKYDVLKITSHPEDGTVKVRWKISVLRLRKLYRVRPRNLLKSLLKANETWIHGFSTYYVMGDGLVHKHIADKMIPDTDEMFKKSEPPKGVAVPTPLAYTNRGRI